MCAYTGPTCGVEVREEHFLVLFDTLSLLQIRYCDIRSTSYFWPPCRCAVQFGELGAEIFFKKRSAGAKVSGGRGKKNYCARNSIITVARRSSVVFHWKTLSLVPAAAEAQFPPPPGIDGDRSHPPFLLSTV